MKRIGTIIMALLLMLGLTQCKKNEPTTTDNQGEAVTITLDVRPSAPSTSSGTGGARVDVNTVTGTVDYEIGDQVHVASNGKYVGTLTYNGTVFVGTITNAAEGLPLYFYFFGNVAPAETLTSGMTESCSVVISNQTKHLPVVSTAPSDEIFYEDVTYYTAFLLNKCALVKFDVTTSSKYATCIKGFNNKVTVNFMENTFTNSQEGEGGITLPAGNGERWAILLPQEAMEAGGMGSACSKDESYAGTRGAVPAITENGFLTDGILVEATNRVVPEGIINSKFTINADGDQIFFSQGNLQYIGSASVPYWQFAENQWDYLGTSTNQNTNSATVDRDLFFWGTSGYDHGATYYYPWATTQIANGYYAYGNSSANLYDQDGRADWGYNAISNGGNQENSGWRTLTKQEWGYVFYNRPDAASKWGHGAVCGVNEVRGLILLPDDWTLPEGLSFTSEYSDWCNVYTLDQWAEMEANGAIFLPAAGERPGTSLVYLNHYGHYWSSSRHISTNIGIKVHKLDFSRGSRSTNVVTDGYFGYSVRLVRNTE